MVEGYTKSGLENRVAKYYEGLYAETFPTGGTRTPVSIKDLDPMLLAFEHRLRGEGYSEALKDLNDIDANLLSWGHYQRLVKMRTNLEEEGISSRLTKADRGHNLGRLGVAYLYMAHRPNAESFLLMAESIADDCDEQESAGLWSIYRALNFTISGDLQAAKDCLDSAEKKVKNSLNKAMCKSVEGYTNIGVLGYHDSMQSKKMLQCYNEAVQLYDATPVHDLDMEVRSLRTFTYLHRARSYSLLGQHEAAKGDFDEARKELEALDNQRVLVYWHTIKGSAEREKGNLARAKIGLEHAQRVSVAIGDRRGEQVTNSLLGKVYRDAAWAIRIQEGKFSDAAVEHLHAAAHYFERALNLERKLGNKPRLVVVLRRLGDVGRELHRAAKDIKDERNFARLAQANYTEATKIERGGLRNLDARATIYDWLERSRLALAMPTPDKFPNAQAALQALQDLREESSPVVVPVAQLEMGIVLLRNKDAYESEEHRVDSPEKAFVEAAELLDQALTDLARDEKGRDDKEKDLKRWAEINYALGTARVGQAISAGRTRRAALEEQARETYRGVLNTYKSPGFVRDTYQDLIAIKEAVGRSKFVDECLEIFRDNWHPESL